MQWHLSKFTSLLEIPLHCTVLSGLTRDNAGGQGIFSCTEIPTNTTVLALS